jgi:hypothetical protein
MVDCGAGGFILEEWCSQIVSVGSQIVLKGFYSFSEWGIF